MSARIMLADRKWVVAIVFISTLVSRSLLADDAVQSPSAEEKNAVAVLAEKGSVIFIDGEYHVTQILAGRELTNEDLQHLRPFKRLKSLSLSNVKITDEAVETLKSLSQLQSLNLPAGAISEEAHQALKKALPNCRIVLPDRRGFGTFGNANAKTSTAPSTRLGAPPTGWGAFEFPPINPAPSISAEVRSPAVQDRLKLSPEQKKEIERVTGRDFQRQQTEDAIKKVLTAEQKTLLKQVLLQREGPTALDSPEIAQELKLTGEQRAAIQKVMDERRKQLMSVGDQLRDRTLDFQKSTKETNQIKRESNERLLAVLTEQQRQAWKSMIGPPLPSSRFGGFPATQPPEETARSVFRNLDRNSDGQLTAEEWHRSRSTRTKFENARIALAFPVNVETFVESYLQLEPSSEDRKP